MQLDDCRYLEYLLVLGAEMYLGRLGRMGKARELCVLGSWLLSSLLGVPLILSLLSVMSVTFHNDINLYYRAI